MDLEFSICRENHAIAEFQAVVQFTSPLDPASFGDVSQVAGAIAQELDLPARVASPSFSFEIGQPGGARFVPPPMHPLAIGFQRFASNGEIDERIGADQNGVTYITRNYLGWEKTRPIIEKAVGQIAVQYAKRSLPVGAVQIQYSNDFFSKADGFVPAQPLFRKDTRWVPAILSDLEDLWHSHVGMFLPGEGYKNLVNVNVDVVFATTPERPEQFTNAKLLILAARQFNVLEGKPPVMTASETPAALLEIFDQVHDLEKQVFFNTLSDEYLEVVHAK